MRITRIFVAAAALALSACTGAVREHAALTQIAPIAALTAGGYDGAVTCAELLSYGDFGIGTFDKLDGEMVVERGRIYQIKADGSVVIPGLATTTPFAAVVRFVPQIEHRLESPLSQPELTALIDAAIPSKNLIYAVRIAGDFELVKTRSVPAQQPPYRPLAAAVRDQREFNLTDKQGVLVGFRIPAYAGGINVPGYHLHFLCAGMRCGGHVLDLKLRRGVLQIGAYRELRMVLPQAGSPFESLDLERDRSAELSAAEHAPAAAETRRQGREAQ